MPVPSDQECPKTTNVIEVNMFAKPMHSLTFLGATLIFAVSASAQPTPHGPYTVSVFAPPPVALNLTNPDSITEAEGDIFVTYANASLPDGTSGSSTVVQYSPTGTIIRTYTIVGKNDGLKFNPYTRKIWALRNEDANPALTIIDPKTGKTTDYTYAQTPLHGGGYDDVVFLNGQIFISASNPNLQNPTPTTPNGQNIFPSIVKARIVGHRIFVTPVLNGNDPLIDIAKGSTVVSQQSDPDSLKVDASGDLVLDSQADGDLIFLNSPGSPNQARLRLHLTNGTNTQITVDDTVFPTAPAGTILVVDTSADTVYAVKSNAYQPGGAYSASDSDGILGKVDLSTGLVTPIVTGMQSPHGALFIPAIPDVSIYRDDDLSLHGGNLNVAFVMTRFGDVSQDVTVNYSVKDLASERNDDKSFTGTVTIPAGKSRAEFNVPVTSIMELIEDGVTQSAIVTLEPGNGYNVVRPATATLNLRKQL
jgi:hypothetical protein